MKIVGVTGSSGSGKTTFSNFWKEKESVRVIHVDDLVSHVKKKYFGAFLDKSRSRKEESSDEQNPTLKLGAKKLFYGNKLLFNMLMKIRSILIRPEMEHLLEEYKRSGIECVVIDDWAIGTHKFLKGKIAELYTIQRDFVTRRRALKQRDGADVDELKVVDTPYALKFVKKAEAKKETVVSNGGTIEDLKRIVQKEIEKHVLPTFDERYKVNVYQRGGTVRSGLEKAADFNKGRKTKEW